MAGRKKAGNGAPKPRASDVRLAAAIAAALEPQLGAVRAELRTGLAHVGARVDALGTRIDGLQAEVRTGLADLGARFDNSSSTSGEFVRDFRRRVEELERGR